MRLRRIFRNHITQSSLCFYRGRIISAPTAVTEFTGSHNAAPADFSAVISPQSSLCFYRGRMISAPTAVTEFTGSHNAAPADFSAVISPQSSLCVSHGRMISAPTAVTEFTGSHNAAPTDFSAIISPQSYPHNRGLRKICQSKAQGSGREGAYFVYATERTGSCNAAMANFFRSPITPSTTWRWP